MSEYKEYWKRIKNITHGDVEAFGVGFIAGVVFMAIVMG